MIQKGRVERIGEGQEEKRCKGEGGTREGEGQEREKGNNGRKARKGEG